jgi:hypothetical protein
LSFASSVLVLHMAEVEFDEQGPDTEDAALRDRRTNSKALKTLGFDASVRKQRQMLGLDSGEYDRARKEAAESTGEPLAGGHSIPIPPDQIRAQMRARRRRRSSSSPDPRKQRDRLVKEPQATSSNQHVDSGDQEIAQNDESDSFPSYDYNSQDEPHSDDAARRGPPRNRMQDLSEGEDDEIADTVGSSRRRWHSPHSGALVDDEGDAPLSTSAPNRYFYYYFDGERQQPRRRRASFDSEATPMMDKRANRKALSILGINPSEEKVMDILGIDQREDLQSAVNAALTPESAQDLPPGRPLQAKALSTLGLAPPPTKADVLLGRYESSSDRALMNEIHDFQMQAGFI